MARILFFISVIAFGGPFVAMGADEFDPIYFFEQDVPVEIQSTQKSKLSVSGQYAKDGRQSLKWHYRAPSTLTVDRDIGFRPFVANATDQRRDAFLTWVYNEAASDGHLLFQFGTDDRVNAWFKISLNFEGWRAVVIAYETEMEGRAVAGMNRLTIVSPNSAKPGNLFFDQMALNLPVDPRHPAKDYIQPFVNIHVEKAANAHWAALLQFDGWWGNFDENSRYPATMDGGHALTTIMARIDEDLLINTEITTVRHLASLNKRYRDFRYQGLENNRNRIRPVNESGRQMQVFKKAKLPETVLAYLASSAIEFHKLGRYMLDLAIAYRKTEDRHVKSDLARRYRLLIRHLDKQGFARGSGQGIMHHQGYVMREWAKSLFLMRDALEEDKKTAQEMLAWYMGLGRIFRPEDTITGFNVDVMNTLSQGILFSILMMPDAQKQMACLRAMSVWMSYSLVHVKGLQGGIQEDGSFFHHAQHYVAYANGALDNLTQIVYWLSKTEFQLTADAHQRIRHSVKMARIFSNGGKAPLSLSGRYPNGKVMISLKPYKYLTLAGVPDNKDRYDLDMARAYLRLRPDLNKVPDLTPQGIMLRKPARDERFTKILKSLNLTAEPDPKGSWVMNLSSLTLHRRQGWLASARGHSRYLISHESYLAANHYGRYITYGHLEITPANPEHRPFDEAGWDWNRWPGTTTIHLPLQHLTADIRQVDAFSGKEEMLLSDESFSGGNHLEGKNAMFAMKLHGHPKYDVSFRARKSVFFFDDLIISLGSGIGNEDENHETETTLFQAQLMSPDTPTLVNGQQIRGLTLNRNMVTYKGYYLLDTNENAYFLAEGQRVKLFRATQYSKENTRDKPTKGDFATAVIAHGKAPRQGRYEYAVLVAAGKEKARAFAARMGSETERPYDVIQHNDQAHIVRDRATGITGYALFTGRTRAQDDRELVLAAVDKPVMVMTQTEGPLLKVSLVNPDLNFYQGIESSQYNDKGLQKEVSIYSRSWRSALSKPQTVELTLKGLWQVAQKNAVAYHVLRYEKAHTIIQIVCQGAKPVQMRFQKRDRGLTTD